LAKYWPLIDGVQALARAGTVTGASARNWEAYGLEVALPMGFSAADQALLSDPQTSGGLLVSCSPEAVDAVLAIFKRHGFGAAAEIGAVVAAGAADSAALRVV
jgi:selenide,water dikinase